MKPSTVSQFGGARPAPLPSLLKIHQGGWLSGRNVLVVAVVGGGLPGLPAELTRAGCIVGVTGNMVDARRILTMLGPHAAVVVDAPSLPATLHASLAVLSRQAAVVVCTPTLGNDPLIALLAQGADAVVRASEAGEVVAVLSAVLRRSDSAVPEPPPDLLCVGDLQVQLSARTAAVGGQCLRLTRLEFELLAYLAAREGESLSREQLLCDVWGYDEGGLDTVTVHVRRLRMKIEQDPSRPTRLQTVRGVGYRLCAHAEAVSRVIDLTAAAG